MKRIFYHMACWLAVLGCAACSNETDFVKTEADNNSIVLDISSATTPVTRAGATGAEVTVSYPGDTSQKMAKIGLFGFLFSQTAACLLAKYTKKRYSKSLTNVVLVNIIATKR